MIVYKVTTLMGKSCFTPYSMALTYTLGKKTTPTIGELFAFSTLGEASDFLFRHFHQKTAHIFHCEAVRSRKSPPLWIPVGCRQNWMGNGEDAPTIYKEYWENKKRLGWMKKKYDRKGRTGRSIMLVWGDINTSYLRVPSGTILCKSITPLEVVKPMRREEL